MKQSKYVPERGHIIWLNFDPQAGHEQSGIRPAIVISPREYNVKVGLSLCCPITNQIKGYPFEVILPEQLKSSGVVLSDQIKCLDWKIRGAKFIEELPEEVVNEILAKVNTLIG